VQNYTQDESCQEEEDLPLWFGLHI
jgi:hypothetical protein